MLERYLHAALTDDAGPETTAETRERLKSHFPPASVRRMTQLGLLTGRLLGQLSPALDDTVIYATGYGESRTLEGYLDSFPTPSPTLFQTSIHPSGVQQGLIARQHPVRELVPLSGGDQLPVQALLVAALAPSARVLLCGGEERGSWLTEHALGSARTFAFALSLSVDPGEHPVARIQLSPTDDASGALGLPAWFDLLRDRRPWDAPAAAGWRLRLDWLSA